jgi:hypothetical protein
MNEVVQKKSHVVYFESQGQGENPHAYEDVDGVEYRLNKAGFGWSWCILVGIGNGGDKALACVHLVDWKQMALFV